jgi:hypothetical protein
MAEFKQMSLRQCAMADAMNYGTHAGEELRKKWLLRRANKRRGTKTNVGDVMHNKKLGRK